MSVAYTGPPRRYGFAMMPDSPAEWIGCAVALAMVVFEAFVIIGLCRQR